MLNIGQVVYDYDNKRVLIFAGTRMLQNQQTGACWVESAFILKDGTFIHYKGKDGDPPKFKYTNIIHNNKPLLGTFVVKAECLGHYFGIIDGNVPDVKRWAAEAIADAEALIKKQGVVERMVFAMRAGRREYYTKVYTGKG